MIVSFHILGYLTSALIFRCWKRFYCNKSFWDNKIWFLGECKYIDSADGKNLVFVPPCYFQRYDSVMSIISEESEKNQIRKIVDFGCAELGFFVFLKRLNGIECIVSVDIDKELLTSWAKRVNPALGELVSPGRSVPLTAAVYCGSVDQYDACLDDTDVVVAIELIEHLHQDVLSKLPANIFGRIRPRLALFTTPNVEFNSLFPKFVGFRHHDHKFEWTRKEFENWATSVVDSYPEYSVKLYGIGLGPPGNEDKGCCSQMAVFSRTATSNRAALNTTDSSYELIHKVEYPFYVDDRSLSDKVLDVIHYRLPRMMVDYISEHDDVDDVNELPLDIFLPLVTEFCSSLDQFRDIMKSAGWKINGTEESPTLEIPHEYLNYSDTDSLWDYNNDQKSDHDYWDGNSDVLEYCDKNAIDFSFFENEEKCRSIALGSDNNEDDMHVNSFSDNIESPHIEWDSLDRPTDHSDISNMVSCVKTDDGSKMCTSEETQKPRSLKRTHEVLSDNKDSIPIRSLSSQLNSGLPTSSADESETLVEQSQKCERNNFQLSDVEDSDEGSNWKTDNPSCNVRNERKSTSFDRHSNDTSTRLAKSFSLDSCLENINCERAEVQVMYLSMHSQARTLESGSPSERGPDSGYPMSYSQDMIDLGDLGTSDDSLSAEVDAPPLRRRVVQPQALVENGDVANNNRDGEGNNVEGVRNPLPPPFQQEEFPPWLLQILRIDPPVFRDEGLGDDSASELSESPVGSSHETFLHML